MAEAVQAQMYRSTGRRHIISARENYLPPWDKPMKSGGDQVKADEILR